MVWPLGMLALLQTGDVTHVPINCSIEGRIPAEKGHKRKLDGLKRDGVFVCMCVCAFGAYLAQADRESVAPQVGTS